MNGIVQLMNDLDKNTEDHFKVLRKIQKDPEHSQRKMADELGFSLGKLNYCLKALRQKAESALGEHFDVRKFHRAVLENGSVPLFILEQNIDAFIAVQKATKI